jgi:2-oxoisovalerate dehydrogenase E1 component
MSANRAEVVDQNFAPSIREGRLPQPRVLLRAEDTLLTNAEIVDMFESQVMSRHLDLAARVLKTRSESFYTIGSAGHEGNAVCGKVFRHTDMAFLHYRSGALFIQRQKQLQGSTPIWDMLLSLAASSEDPISQGRHKVFGSLPLNVPPQTSTIASHLPKAVGMALSIRRSADLGLPSQFPRDSVVLCNFGDASYNHATAQSAFNAACWSAYQNVPVPIVFVCEDNGIGISVPTPGGWVRREAEARPGWRYFTGDGRHLLDAHRAAEAAVNYTRSTRKPAFLHMTTVRLLGHAGSDMETAYNSMAAIEAAERDDPLLHSARILIENGILSGEEIINLYETVRQRVMRAAEHAITRPKLTTAAEVMASVVPPKSAAPLPALPSADQRTKLFGFDMRYMDKPQHMAKHINWALADAMARYPNTVLFGEDVAQKGGVYNVTTGLLQKFGARRVFNSLLDETSILGTAIGLAHNGFLPIPEIQFLAYVHNAEDQLRGEASTLSFFSSGQYTNPMVMRVAGLAYQKGFGGHFHNDNSLAIFRDLPGVIIACPSNGPDAARMMRRAIRAAHQEGRVVVFVEPIALYMTKDLHETGDGGWSFLYPDPNADDAEIELGEFSVYGDGDDLAIITYGNGYYLSRQAEKILAEEHDVGCRVIDLRWLAPVDEAALAAAVKGCRGVLVVDECRKTGSQSEALVTALVERLAPLPRIKRITAEDCFIPLGRAATVTLPSRDDIVVAGLSLVRTAPVTQISSAKTKAKGKAAKAKRPAKKKPAKKPTRAARSKPAKKKAGGRR